MAFDRGPTEPDIKSFMNTCIEYLNSSEILYENTNISDNSPFYYLASHTYELHLKAFLKFKGLDYPALQKMKHGLKGILSKCIELGFKEEPIDMVYCDIFCNLNKNNRLRYPMNGLFLIGPIEESKPENIMLYLKEISKRVSSEVKQ